MLQLHYYSNISFSRQANKNKYISKNETCLLMATYDIKACQTDVLINTLKYTIKIIVCINAIKKLITCQLYEKLMQ